MIIKKAFWLKETDTTKQAFSYDNKTNVAKFVKQYGGTALNSLNLSDEVEPHIPAGADVYSVLVNTEKNRPRIAEEVATRYKILIKDNDGEYRIYDNGYSSLREANTIAKNITKFYSLVLVIKDRFVDAEVDESVSEELIFG